MFFLTWTCNKTKLNQTKPTNCCGKFNTVCLELLSDEEEEEEYDYEEEYEYRDLVGEGAIDVRLNVEEKRGDCPSQQGLRWEREKLINRIVG